MHALTVAAFAYGVGVLGLALVFLVGEAGGPTLAQARWNQWTNVFLLVAFLAFGNRIGGAYYDGAWHWTPPFLSTAFFSIYLPLFVVRWGLSVVLDLVLLRQGRWQLGTRIADLLFHCLDIYILSRLLTGPSIINAQALQSMLAAAPQAADVLNKLFDNGLKIGFLIALIVTIIEVLSRVYRLVRNQLAVRAVQSQVGKLTR